MSARPFHSTTKWIAPRAFRPCASNASALDDQPFKVELDPGNPAADEKGFVKMPNVNLLVELADMREANRSYEANLQVVKQSGDLTSMTIGLLKD